MGFMDKLKALFKKKDNAGEKKACGCGCRGKPKAAEPASYASQFSGDSAVAKALIHAAEALDKKVAAGLAVNKANLYLANLKAIEASADSDDVKLIGIGQVIGQIFRS